MTVAQKTIRQQASSVAVLPAAPVPTPAWLVTAMVAGLAAAWIAASSVGLLSHTLRHALGWAALGVTLVACWRRGRSLPVFTIAGAIASVLLTASANPIVNILAVAALLAGLGLDVPTAFRRPLIAVAAAVGVFALYRFELWVSSAFWLLADGCGAVMGGMAGRVTGQPLSVGVTFSGLDFLVLMGAVCAGWLALSPAGTRPGRAIIAGIAIISGVALYLAVLSEAPRMLASLPQATTPPPDDWAATVRELIPWNLPVLGAVVELMVAALMFRWGAMQSVRALGSTIREGAAPAEPQSVRGGALGGSLALARSGEPTSRPALLVAAIALALILPVVSILCWGRSDLRGKKFVFYEKGFLNWLKPEHGEYGRLSVGMYGMLEPYIESLGGHFKKSPDLSAQDLSDADVLVIIFPDKPWQPGQLDRVHQFVERGGTLLLLSDHTIRTDDTDNNPANDVLKPTSMRINFDTAEFAVGGWLHSYEPLAHPTTLGIHDDRNEFGVVIGASVDTHFPARPLLLGRWGWDDAGDAGNGESKLGDIKWNAGERLGDVVLVSEQTLGKGRVVVFGDTSSITNGINVGSHPYTSRLFNYLANGPSNPQSPWRQVLGFLLVLGLSALLLWRPDATRIGAAAIALAIAITSTVALSQHLTQTLPDGSRHSPNNLAYLDVSHLPSGSEESWRPDGSGGLALTLMRNGYLALDLPELTRDRLDRAGLLVEIAPLKPFTLSERRIIRDFVEKGGIFILTVGYDSQDASRSLLDEFGFYIGSTLNPDGAVSVPKPLGHFKAPYYDGGDYLAYVRFHAAWPVRSREPDPHPIAWETPETPVILMRKVGQGKVVVIGDTAFAMNKNLENENGEPFEGMRENADFWRWFLPVLNGQPQWIPPKPATQPATAPSADVNAIPATQPDATQPVGPQPPVTQPTSGGAP